MQSLLVVYQLIIFAVFIYFYRFIAFSKKHVNISFFHFAYFFIFFYIGASELYIDGDLSNNKYFFSLTLYPLVALSGMLTARLFVANNDVQVVVRRSNLKYLYIFVVGISLTYINSLENIPLLYVLKGDPIAAAISRTTATKEFAGFKIVYYSFRVVVDYLLIFILLFEFLKKERITLRFLVLFALSSFITLVDTQKYPILNIIIMLSIAVYFYNKAKKGIELKLSTIISFKMILLVVVSYLVLGTLWAAAAGRLGDRSVFETFESIIQNGNSMVTDRLVNGENRPLYAIYGMVPKNYDYFFGQTFPNPLRLMPFEPVPLSYLVYDEVHPGGEGNNDVRGAAPTTFFSVIYANFGIIVSFISMYLFGFIVQLLNDKLLYNEKYIIPYRFVWMNYVTLFATSIDIPFLSEKVLILIAVYFLMYKKIPKHLVSIAK